MGDSSCQRCKTAVKAQVSAGNFKFAHAPRAPAPTNTGASSVDHDVDVVIGRDSQLRLAEMHKRQDFKRGIMRSNQLETGEKLSRLDDGDYFVMNDEEQVAAKRARVLNSEAMIQIKEFKERRDRQVKSRSSRMAP